MYSSLMYGILIVEHHFLHSNHFFAVREWGQRRMRRARKQAETLRRNWVTSHVLPVSSSENIFTHLHPDALSCFLFFYIACQSRMSLWGPARREHRLQCGSNHCVFRSWLFALSRRFLLENCTLGWHHDSIQLRFLSVRILREMLWVTRPIWHRGLLGWLSLPTDSACISTPARTLLTWILQIVFLYHNHREHHLSCRSGHCIYWFMDIVEWLPDGDM